ncbi:MAG: 3-isopropylmalate dehydratase small subunit [Deltaproteobacteria bacterium]|nr:3-isopropylmalate dehydratase small subunit [Deltaproteobacteria bacterium]
MKYSGTVWKFGDHVDTDVIIPARYLTTSDPQELGRHCLEDADPDFVKKIHPGDLIVAGRNFGSGSSREHAPIAIKAAGISCVIAESFARIFYRNAINMGLPIFESPEASQMIKAGDRVRVNTQTGIIEDLTLQKKFQAEPMPPFMQELIRDGGLIKHVKKVQSSKFKEKLKRDKGKNNE